MKIVSSILFFLFCFQAAICQDEPYYKDLPNRQRDDLKFLPNLETSKTRLYLTGFMSFGFQNSTITSPKTARYGSTGVTNLNYGGALGVNFNDNWYYDVGVSANPMFMVTKVDNGAGNQRSISFSSGMKFTAYSATIRKRVWQIDKVTKNAAMLLTAGLMVSPALSNVVHEDRLLRFGINSFNGSNPDTANYRITTRSEKLKLIPQLGFEISGKIIEQVEIGIYSKVSFQSKGTLFNDITFNINSEPSTAARQDLGALNLDFGVMLRWNLINWVNYKSKVE